MKITRKKRAKLVFECGACFEGNAFAGLGERFGEVVFNTAMSGYQEILTDPSYCGQMVVMTYPLIGNYGINCEDIESRGLFLSALLVREYCDAPSNWRSTKSLRSYLNDHNILGVEDLDTRAITRFIRESGAQRAIITTKNEPMSALLKKVNASQSMQGLNLVRQVTSHSPYQWAAPAKKQFRVAVIDCGVKYQILRQLRQLGCQCYVFPADVAIAKIKTAQCDGIFISNGPGDPEPVKPVIKLIQTFLGRIPIFGICLGHQLLGLALGGNTYKLKFGHHGANHPVMNLKTGHVEITSQNHGFCLDMNSLNKKEVEITHINLNDQTVEGIRHKTIPAFSVQYHPEAAPGPHDSHYLFQEFIKLMAQKEKKSAPKKGTRP